MDQTQEPNQSSADQSAVSELIVAVLSDTHDRLDFILRNQGVSLHDVDVVIFPGDFTSRGSLHELREWRDTVQEELLNKGKIVVACAGNHELGLERNPEASMAVIKPDPGNGFYWLHDSSCVIQGFVFWGSPYTPAFCNWAFNIHTEEELLEHFKTCPEKVDVMVTHGPPKRILDKTDSGHYAGSQSLRDIVEQRQPQLNCFGHIHEAYGTHKYGKTTYINGSICTVRYHATNPIQKFILRG